MIDYRRNCLGADVYLSFKVDLPRVHEEDEISESWLDDSAVQLRVITCKDGLVVLFKFRLSEKGAC